MFKKLSIKGILLGSITDIVATNILTLPLVIFAIIPLMESHTPQDKISEATMNILQHDPIYFSLGMALGGLCSILGGYVAARIAKHDEILNGACASILCSGIGIYSITAGSSHSPAPLWFHLVSIPAAVTLCALGGYMRMKQVQSKTN